MSILAAICIMVLCLLGIFLLCLTAVWLEKRFPVKNHDERQERFRGHACRLSFVIGLLYYGFVTVLLMAQQRQGQTIEPYLPVLAGIILQAAVYRVYCMITQSFMSPSQKPAGMLLRELFLGMIATLCYLASVRWNILEEMGYPASFEWIFLILAVMEFSFALCYLCLLMYQRLCGERE